MPMAKEVRGMGSQTTDAKKAMKAAKTRRAMEKNKVKRIREKPKCRCTGCESCNSRAPCKISLHSGGLCSGCKLKKGTAEPAATKLAKKSKRNQLLNKRYRRKQPPRFEAPSCQRGEHGQQTCGICCESMRLSKAFLLDCQQGSHGWYCADCLNKHAATRLIQGDVSFSCPACREVVPDYITSKFLQRDYLERFHRNSLQKAIAVSSRLFSCPTPDCTVCLWLDDLQDTNLNKCPLCKKSGCLKCGAQPYHTGVSCAEHARRAKRNDQAQNDILLNKWMESTGSKICPQCGEGITKENLEKQCTEEEECHKVKCRMCHTRFCFKCSAVLTDVFTCGCSRDDHYFVSPCTRRFERHLRKPR